jgi:Cdc6-like AAA superfamily ATPase
MTERRSWPLEGLGLFTGNSHNILIAGPEGSGKTSNACTILSHLLSTEGLKRLTVISPALAASPIKTDFNGPTLVPPELCELIPISALSDDPVENYEILEEAYAPCIQ